MSRSSKKGPFVDPKLMKRVEEMNDSKQKRMLKTWSREARNHATAATLVLPLVAPSGETEKLLIGVFFDRQYEAVDQIDFMDASQPSM